MKKILFIILVIVIIYLIPRGCNYLCSIGETPQVTDYGEEKIEGGYYSSHPYTLYNYHLHDTTRQCHLGNPETFSIVKKEEKIEPDDKCDHCNMKWSWHFKK